MPERIERLQLRESTGPCEVHEWTIEQWRKDFLPLLRARHDKGGVNVCAECIRHVKHELGKLLGKAQPPS